MPLPVFTTQGGSRTASIYSGIIAGQGLTGAPGAVNVGSDTLLFSGAGRLQLIYPHLSQIGTAVVFYDAPAAVSGGPIYTSGHRVIGVLPGTTHGPVSGTGPLPIAVGVPFYSGLVAAVRSGCTGFTVSYQAESLNQGNSAEDLF